MWYIYTTEYYLAIKNEIMLFAGKMDGTGDRDIEGDKPDWERQKCFCSMQNLDIIIIIIIIKGRLGGRRWKWDGVGRSEYDQSTLHIV
jgi:hypothetical protein